jgi:hypothetical protein
VIIPYFLGIFGSKKYLKPGEDNEQLLQCLEDSDIEDLPPEDDDYDYGVRGPFDDDDKEPNEEEANETQNCLAISLLKWKIGSEINL